MESGKEEEKKPSQMHMWNEGTWEHARNKEERV